MVDRRHAKPGAAMKALRAKHDWTLAEVSKRTGLTISALSKIENDKIDLSFEKLVRISEGLEIDISELFGTATGEEARGGSARRSIARAGEGRLIEAERGSYLYVASELVKKKMIPIVGEVFAKDISQYRTFLSHTGEEYIYVLEGTLELHTKPYTPVILEKGDSIYFDSSMGHAYVAVGNKPCRILSICATSEARLMDELQHVSAESVVAIFPTSTPAKPSERYKEHKVTQRKLRAKRRVRA
jgi:transcriptional regulator with XRE-family HTH domain